MLARLTMSAIVVPAYVFSAQLSIIASTMRRRWDTLMSTGIVGSRTLRIAQYLAFAYIKL
jgi:hypothetical protein